MYPPSINHDQIKIGSSDNGCSPILSAILVWYDPYFFFVTCMCLVQYIHMYEHHTRYLLCGLFPRVLYFSILTLTFHIGAVY